MRSPRGLRAIDVAGASPEETLADVFSRHVERWSEAAGAAPVLARAAAEAAHALSLATSAGNVCLAPDELPLLAGGPQDAQGWRTALLASGVAGTPSSPGSFPLILDDEGRLYLHRDFDFERRLARRIALARATPPPSLADAARVRDLLAHLFAANEARLGDAADWQKLAAALALRGRLAVISGGPGTGKTTTVVNLLACLLALQPDCRIALAAPTGKAAARLTEAIRQRADHLQPALRDRLPKASSTLHRLLRAGPDGRFGHDGARPLAIDALVVDEASMIDLALATRLLEAVPAHARIILLGDKDQLSAVEAGAVFAELSADPSLEPPCIAELAALSGTPPERIHAPEPAQASPLHDAAVWFTQNFRFATDSGIGRLAALVKAGDAEGTLAWLEAGADAAVRWHPDPARRLADATLAQIEAAYGGYAAAVASNPRDVASATLAFARFRVLCAQREGPRGVVAINDEMTRRLRARMQPSPPTGAASSPAAVATAASPSLAADGDGDGHASPWYVGRPVIVLDNDYVLRLFNGDLGLALPDENGELKAHFADAAAPGGFRVVAPARLPRHETAFAMTVHKSQGSEFEDVLVVLPARTSRVCTRELLYTAVTRARRGVSLVAPAEVLARAVATPTRRRSGLLARLAEALHDPSR